MFSLSKKPKFSLDLTINELSNIPQVDGYCYIEVQIRDGKRRIPHINFGSNISEDTGNDNDKSEKNGKDGSDSSLSLSDRHSNSAAGNISVTTSRRKVQNFRCNFNYHLSCNLKFPFKKKENLITSKYLTMKVHYVRDRKSSHKDSKSDKDGLHSSHDSLELGVLRLNLSEYVNFEEPITSKYLMHDSKVNSTLNLTIFLKELPSNYDFHTQLQITDSSGQESTNGSFSSSSRSGSRKFNAPVLQKNTLFGGIGDVIRSPTSETFSNNSDHLLPTSSLNESSDKNAKGKKLTHQLSVNFDDKNNGSQDDIMLHPNINSLYKKVLQSSWDPKLQGLLSYSPDQCIDDIFSGSPEKIKRAVENRYAPDDDEESDGEQNGLIDEKVYREDLKSWSVGMEDEK